MRFEIRHFLFFFSKFQWISNLSASIESSQQRGSILLLKKPRALQNDEKMKQMWKSWNFRWDSKSHQFQFFIFKFLWISDLRALIKSFHQGESIYVSQEAESSSEWWKMKHMWKSWNFRWDSISHHFQYFRIKFQWITDLISAIESSHRAESNTVLEKSRAHQNAEKNWNLLRMHHFRSKFTTFPYEHLEAQAWTDNKTITISSVLSHCMLENCSELIWMIGFR